MSVIDSLLSLVAPHECLSCTAEGSLLCGACAALLPDAPQECYFCRQPSPGSQTCAGCFRRAGLHQVVVATVYGGVTRRLIWKLKFGGAQAAARDIVAALPSLALSGVVIVPVPTAAGRVRRRGYDQACLLAAGVSGRYGVPVLPCLRRLGRTHQLGANRAERLAQLLEAFVVASPARVRGKWVLLIDDVITTGATFEAAARVLYAAGVVQISALAFARSE